MIPGMLNDDDKKGLGALLSGKDDSEESPAVEKDDMGLKQASEDIMNAFHTKDTDALLSGLSSFIDLHSMQSQSDEKESDSEPEGEGY